MGQFLSTDTVLNSYKILADSEIDSPSILFTFFILKGCGLSNMEYTSVKKIQEEAYSFAKPIAYLFSPFEKASEKSDFINPFSMKDWGTNPKEPLKKWASGRLKNNILGGATTWRKIIKEDFEENSVRFTHNYISEIKELIGIENTINLQALSVWAHRFTYFEKPPQINALIENFITLYNLNQNEISNFFHTKGQLTLTYSIDIHNAQEIREHIGSPSNDISWVKSEPLQNINYHEIIEEMQSTLVNQSRDLSVDFLQKLIGAYSQIILSGPPATSKTYLANQLSKEYDNQVLKIQFHPQYSYQTFIGGYVVRGSDVTFQKGVLLKFLNEIDKTKKSLIVIDEINRANLSQVFGELISCLDRDYSTQVVLDDKMEDFSLPPSVHIIATMNSADRTIGSIDYALRRRFLNIYCSPNADLLLEACSTVGNISLKDLLQKINNKILEVLNSRELLIGHALFMANQVYRNKSYQWKMEELEILFNYKILPIIEEYCHGNYNNVVDIVGKDLSLRLSGEHFENALEAYLG